MTSVWSRSGSAALEALNRLECSLTTTTKLEDAFAEFIRQEPFPCVAAKSALANHAIETYVARDIGSGWDDLAIHAELSAFSDKIRNDESKVFRSLAVLFETPRNLSERAFEQQMWTRLQSLRDKDRWLSYRHDPRVDADPASPDFAFSIGGEGFFVVGMHPRSSRVSRRSPMPALVFNPFIQFERLRVEGRFDRMSSVVRKRDEVMCGSPNPMLAHHGEGSAARQFSGRDVDADWICPMRASGRDVGADILLAVDLTRSRKSLARLP